MVRSFSPHPVDPEILDTLLDLVRRAPSAGNTRAPAFVVLEGDETARLWDVTLPAEGRATFRWPGLLVAPVVIVPLVEPAAYARRYAEDDKASTGLGTGLDAWPVPLPENWAKEVDRAQTEAEVEALRRSVQRGQPYGSESWSKRTAAKLGLESTLRARGRPAKKREPS